MSPSHMRSSVRWKCRFKKRYSTEYEVVHAMAKVPAEQAVSLEAYICPNCGHMHLGHKPKYAARLKEVFG
jgi:rubrerythrin